MNTQNNNNQTPDLTSIGYRTHTHEELEQLVPAAFSPSKHPERSNLYSFLPTTDLLDAFEKAGWNPTYAKQNGKSPFARHTIRFENPDLGWLPINGDKIKPQAIIDNSHDGGSCAQLHMGLFRLVCSNGLVIAIPNLATSIKIRHMGFDSYELIKLMENVAEDYSIVGKRINDWQDVKLNKDQKEEFAMKAIALREPHAYINEDGTINSKRIISETNPVELIKPIRNEDEANNLWSVFNVVQERIIKGGYQRKGEKTQRIATVRGIKNATRNINLNKALWQLAEEYVS